MINNLKVLLISRYLMKMSYLCFAIFIILDKIIFLRNKISITTVPQCLLKSIAKDCINTNFHGMDALI